MLRLHILNRLLFGTTCLSQNGNYTKISFANVIRSLCQGSEENLVGKMIGKEPSTKHDTRDLLMDSLVHSRDLSSLMNSVSRHSKIMNNKHLAIAFDRLHTLLKSENLSGSGELSSSTHFRDLSNQVLKKVRFFDLNEVTNILKTLVMLDVPTNAAVVQALLQMIRHSCNDLNIRQVSFLFSLLPKMNKVSKRTKGLQAKDALLESITMALPMILKAKFQYELDGQNLDLLVNVCHISFKSQFKVEEFEKVINLLLEKIESLNTHHLVYLFIDLRRYKITNQEESLSLNDLEQQLVLRLCPLVPSLSKKYTNALLTFGGNYKSNGITHSSKLLTHICHKCVTEDWDLNNFSWLIKAFRRFSFVSTEVLDLLARKMKSNAEQVVNDRTLSILDLVDVFAFCDYLPGASKDFLGVIPMCTSKLKELEESSPQLFLKLVTGLAMLEAVTPDLLQRVLDKDFMTFLLSKDSRPEVCRQSLQNYRLLEQVVRIELKDSYFGSALPKEMLAKAIFDRSQVIKPIDLVFKEFLQIGLGGPQFVLNNLWTEYGHYIDHLIVMRKGDFPVAIGSDRAKLECTSRENGLCYVEDVVIPPESKTVAILLARPEWFTNDPPRLSGWMSLEHRTLTKLGYNPVILGPPNVNEGQIQDLLPLQDDQIHSNQSV